MSVAFSSAVLHRARPLALSAPRATSAFIAVMLWAFQGCATPVDSGPVPARNPHSGPVPQNRVVPGRRYPPFVPDAWVRTEAFGPGWGVPTVQELKEGLDTDQTEILVVVLAEVRDAALQHETTTGVRERLVFARESVPRLLPLLTHRHVGIRLAAIRALGAIGDPRAVPGLVASLRDRTPVHADIAYYKHYGSVSWASLGCEVGIGWANTVVPLGCVSADAIARIGGEEGAVSDLLVLARDPSLIGRGIVLQAIGRLGTPGTLKALDELAEANDGPPKAAVVSAQSAIRMRAMSVPELGAQLQGDDPVARYHAIEQLGERGTHECIGALATVFADDRIVFRETVPPAIGYTIGDHARIAVREIQNREF